jgi:hypothetical protein
MFKARKVYKSKFVLSELVSRVVVCSSAENEPANSVIKSCKNAEVVQKEC